MNAQFDIIDYYGIAEKILNEKYFQENAMLIWNEEIGFVLRIYDENTFSHSIYFTEMSIKKRIYFHVLDNDIPTSASDESLPLNKKMMEEILEALRVLSYVTEAQYNELLKQKQKRGK